MPGGDQRPRPLATPPDPLALTYDRSALLSLLFRETDRAQRMKTPLSLLLFNIDEVSWWSARLGKTAGDELLSETVSRIERQLRSYDVLGRLEEDEFLAVLPGCSPADATLLAQRLSVDVFARAFRIANETIQMSACFGIASSDGRSPIVVLHEVVLALKSAKETGPSSIRCFGADQLATSDPSNWLASEGGTSAP
jgi:two-component system, cell cycle response regulator